MTGRLRGLALAVALLALCALALSAWATAAAQDEGSKTITGLTLSSDSPGELEIAWNAASPEATDYRVNWARSDEDFPSWNETGGNSYPTTNSLTLTGLDQGVEYKVQVRARYGGDGAHSGPWSGVARATVAATPEPTPESTPDPTPDPTPVPDRHVSGLTLGSSSPGELEITWNAAGQEATDYRVNWARSDEDFPSWNETEGNSYPTTNSLTLTGLDQGVQYKVQVRARYGGDGAHSGPWSGEARATVAAEGSGSGAGNPPAAPTGLLTAATHDSVLLAWDNPDDDSVTGYRVLRRVRTEGNELKVIAPDTGSAATSYTDETVAAETAYEYQVKAINARGVSEASASANANTPAAPVLRQDDPPVEDDEPQPETAQQQSGGDIIIVDGPGRKLVSRRFVTPGIEHYQTVDGGVPYSSRIHRDAFDTSYSSIDLIAGNRYTVHITGRDRESGEDGGTDPLRKGHLYGIFEPDNLLTPHAIRIVPASGWVDEDSDHSPTEDVVWNFVARKTGRHSIRTNGKAFECLLFEGKRHNCTYAGFYLVRVTSGADDGDRAGAVGLGEIAWMRGMEPTRPFVQALARGNQIGGSDRVDYYSFSFDQRAQILLNLTDLDINVNLYLEDEDGKTILATNQPGSDDIELTRALNPGRYYVRITSTASTAGVYRFTYHVIAAEPSAALDALRVSPKDIIGFKPNRASYEVGMASTVTRATITPIARDSTASIGYSTDDADTGSNARGHQVDLSAGKNTVTVTVRSGSLTEEYTVNINRGVSAGYGWKAADDLDGLIAAGNDSAYGIWSNASTIWVADNSDGKLYAYRKSDKTRDSGKDFDTLTAAGNENPNGIWSDDATMWVLQESGRIYAYRMSDKAQDTTKEFTTPPAAGASDTNDIWSDGVTMWVSDGSDAKVYAFRMSDKTQDAGKEFNTLTAAGNESPTGIWSDGVTMWVADLLDAKIYAYRMSDKARDASKDFTTLGSAGNSLPTSLWSDGATMWAADREDDKVYSYNHP